MRRRSSIGFALLLGLGSAGHLACLSAYRQSVGAEEQKIYQRVYLADYNTVWQAVLDALKSYKLEVSNREGGYLETQWQDNTSDRNLIESFGAGDAYQRSEQRVRVTVTKGYYNGNPSVKVMVQKEQRVQRDVLDGMKPLESDGVDEQTLLYRVSRVTYMRLKLAEMEEAKTKAVLDGQGTDGGGNTNGPGNEPLSDPVESPVAPPVDSKEP